MVMVGSSPPEQQSPYGDGRYLLHMLLGQRTAPAQQMAPELGTQAVGPPTPLGELPSDAYVDDPASMAEINPLAAAPTPAPARTPPTNMPMARPGVPNTPMARPAPVESGSLPEVRSVMDNMRTMLNGNTAAANPATATSAVDNIDGNPAPAGDDQGSWYTPLVKGGIAAAIIAAILSGRGRSAMPNSGGSGSVVPTTPGMDGVVIPPGRLSGPSAGGGMSPSPAQIETDILSVMPNEIGAQPRGALTGPNDAVVAQGRPQSVTPDVINQSGPNVQRGLESQGVRYRGRTYYLDESGNVTDRNGDIVRATNIANEVKSRFARQGVGQRSAGASARPTDSETFHEGQ